MSSNMNQVRAALIEQMARLNSENMTPEQLKAEVEKSRAMAELGGVLIDSAKAELDFIRLTKGDKSEFFNSEAIQTLPEVKSNILIPEVAPPKK